MALLIFVLAVSIGAFLLAFWLLRIIPVAQNAITTVRNAVGRMRDPDIDDLAREKAAQKAGIELVVFSGALILRSGIALAAAGVPVVLADWAGLVPVSVTLGFMERWEVIVTVSVLVVLGYIAIVHLWPR